jgi:hypothetical protein
MSTPTLSREAISGGIPGLCLAGDSYSHAVQLSQDDRNNHEAYNLNGGKLY